LTYTERESKRLRNTDIERGREGKKLGIEKPKHMERERERTRK
jgi:hypothetical protein